MPRIVEYNPSTPRLGPNDRALQAWETTGRRVGPLYNQAAQEMEQAGRVQGDMERAKAWPFDVYALEASTTPKITTSTTNESRGRSSAGGADLRGGIGEADGGTVGGSTGTVGRADMAIQYADAGYATTPQSAANASNDVADEPWLYAHGEASAGAVGMSRLARAAAGGGAPNVNPNSNLPVNWRDNPDMNGQNTIDTGDGNQWTPAQMQRFTDEANKRAQTNMDIWNRQQEQYWNGPNGWNTRRDKAVFADEKNWWQGYQDDLTAQDKIVNGYMKKNPDADRAGVIQDVYAQRHVFPTTGGGGPDYGGGGDSLWSQAAGAVGGVLSPANIVGALKDTFGGMFGDDEPAATADVQ